MRARPGSRSSGTAGPSPGAAGGRTAEGKRAEAERIRLCPPGPCSGGSPGVPRRPQPGPSQSRCSEGTLLRAAPRGAEPGRAHSQGWRRRRGLLESDLSVDGSPDHDTAESCRCHSRRSQLTSASSFPPQTPHAAGAAGAGDGAVNTHRPRPAVLPFGWEKAGATTETNKSVSGPPAATSTLKAMKCWGPRAYYGALLPLHPPPPVRPGRC